MEPLLKRNARECQLRDCRNGQCFRSQPGEPPQINRSTREDRLFALQLVFPRSTPKRWALRQAAKTFGRGQENQRGSAEIAAQDHYSEAR
jgi:hypothetical protein